jgi:hypothetical protein
MIWTTEELQNAVFASEIQLQAACHQWTWKTFKQLRRTFFKVHNEGKKRKVRAIQDRSAGIVPGAPDHVFPPLKIVVEFKMPGEKQSDDQKACQASLEACGVKYFLVDNGADYISILTSEVERWERNGRL